MERIPVKSSNIRSVGFDGASGTLEVEFHNGGVYQYFKVPAVVYSAFMSARSKGSYLNDQIRKRYRFRQVK